MVHSTQRISSLICLLAALPSPGYTLFSGDTLQDEPEESVVHSLPELSRSLIMQIDEYTAALFITGWFLKNPYNTPLPTETRMAFIYDMIHDYFSIEPAADIDKPSIQLSLQSALVYALQGIDELNTGIMFRDVSIAYMSMMARVLVSKSSRDPNTIELKQMQKRTGILLEKFAQKWHEKLDELSALDKSYQQALAKKQKYRTDPSLLSQ